MTRRPRLVTIDVDELRRIVRGEVEAAVHSGPRSPAAWRPPRTMAGAYDRDRVRVGTIGGRCGTGRGRAEWERRYYPQQITARRPVGEDVDGQIAAVLDRVKAQD